MTRQSVMMMLAGMAASATSMWDQSSAGQSTAGVLPTGACCIAADTCIETDSATCASMNGEYHGDGSDCSDVNECLIGQCCMVGPQCTNTTIWDCFTNLGGYVFIFATCETYTCFPYGACCLNGSFCYVTFEQSCINNGGTYLGDLSECDPGNTCPGTGACCESNGTCTVTTQVNCETVVGGTYQGNGTDCGTVSCGALPYAGACCVFDLNLNDYVCSVTDRDTCENAMGGEYYGDGSLCEDKDVVCAIGPALVGACCLGNGECHETTENICAAAFGTYHGGDTFCIDVTCPGGPLGACCLINGACVQTTEDDCLNVQGGIQWQAGVSCAAAGCVAPLGQCCIPDGTCVNTDIDTCFATYQGGYWSYPSDCNNACAPFGACCGVNGCRITVEFFCTGPGDVWKGDHTTCADDDGVDGADVCEPCPADIAPVGGDGQVNIDDLTAVILNWGSSDPIADITNDGTVNIDDLTAIILSWGPCP